jgi:hypothetical protein
MSSAVPAGVSFLAGFRARRHRAAILVLFGWLLVAQTLLVAHRIEHYSGGDGLSCALCIAGDHTAAIGDHPLYLITDLKPQPVAVAVIESASRVIFLSYHSRAPPEHLDT